MAKLFPEIPEAMRNTLEIRDKCDLTFKFGNNLLPDFKVPEGYDTESYLLKLVNDGIKKNIQSLQRKSKTELILS